MPAPEVSPREQAAIQAARDQVLRAADDVGAALLALPTDVAAAVRSRFGAELRALSAAVSALRRCAAPLDCADALHSISAKSDRLLARWRARATDTERRELGEVVEQWDAVLRRIPWTDIPTRIRGARAQSRAGVQNWLALVLVAVLLLRRR